MKRSVQIIVASLALALLAFGGVASCKQGEGERCEVDEDCEDGECSEAEGVCRTGPTGDIDAELPPDAPPDAPDAM